MPLTKIENLINPEVMGDMISAKIENKIIVSPFAKIDRKLEGIAGDTITVPQYDYIGDAADVGEGEEVSSSILKASTTKVKVKKAMKAVELSDEAILSGYGNPVGETNNQLALSIAAKVDADAMDALQGADKVIKPGTKISYNGIIDAIDLFNEEINSEKVMFIHPKQLTTLRKDQMFVSADKYPGEVAIKGEIGKIANTRIVTSKRVPKNEAIPEKYISCTEDDEGALEVIASGTPQSTEVLLSVVTEHLPEAKAGDYVMKVPGVSAGSCYCNPIVKLEEDTETEDALPALTIYLKRDTNVESQRFSTKRITNISVDKMYAAALTNQAKVVLALFKV